MAMHSATLSHLSGALMIYLWGSQVQPSNLWELEEICGLTLSIKCPQRNVCAHGGMTHSSSTQLCGIKVLSLIVKMTSFFFKEENANTPWHLTAGQATHWWCPSASTAVSTIVFLFFFLDETIFFFYCHHNINMLYIFLQSTVSRNDYGGRQGPNNTIS